MNLRAKNTTTKCIYKPNKTIACRTPIPEEMEVLNPEVLIPLREWVTSRGVPETAAHALTMHEFTLTDLLEHAQREDISRLNLK